ncbi:tetratricopeptide repeat protein [bacterium]|nr:tetratricopeptide repeat protein [bacterium]
MSIDRAPDFDFLKGIYGHAVSCSLQDGGKPGSYVIATLFDADQLAVFTFIFDIRRSEFVEQLIYPISDNSMLGCVFGVFHQIARSIEHRQQDDFYAQMHSPSKEYKNAMQEFATQLGIALAQNRSFELARGVWMESLETYDPKAPEILQNIGQSFSVEEKFEEAEDWFAIAIENAPTDRRYLPLYNRGISRAKREMFEEAITDFRACVLLRPEFGVAYNNLGTCLSELGRVEEAIGWFQKCLSLSFDPSEAELGIDTKKYARDTLCKLQ